MYIETTRALLTKQLRVRLPSVPELPISEGIAMSWLERGCASTCSCMPTHTQKIHLPADLTSVRIQGISQAYVQEYNRWCELSYVAALLRLDVVSGPVISAYFVPSSPTAAIS
jgi:hypothetical protein